jgi:hypothetical protein
MLSRLCSPFATLLLAAATLASLSAYAQDKGGPRHRGGPPGDRPGPSAAQLLSNVLGQFRGDAPQPVRDPTVPGPWMAPLMRKSAGTVAIPDVQLRGLVLAQGQPPRVMLEVNKRMHMLSQGGKISLGSGEILVQRIAAGEVELEVQPLQYTLTLH